MRLIILALLLALAFGTAQAIPLQGSDGTATVTLFGSIRTPLNDTLEILKVDIGLMGTENATYKLMDQNGTFYEPGLYKTLSSGRQLVYFLIPKDDLFKLITATPLGRKSININWWARPKVENENLAIRYYGIADWLTNLNEEGIIVQSLVVQVTAENKGTQDMLFSPENFTLLDQWGWPYNPTAGFDSEIIAPQKTTTRVLLGFTNISLFSRPAALMYGYNTVHPIVVDFEKDFVPLSNDLVYGANATTSAATTVPASAVTAPALPAPTSTAVSTPAPAANQTAPANTSASNTSLKSTVGSSLNSSLSASKARLAAMRENLHKKTQNDTSNSTSASNATLNTVNSTLNSTMNSTLNKTPDSSKSSMSNSMLSFSA